LAIRNSQKADEMKVMLFHATLRELVLVRPQKLKVMRPLALVTKSTGFRVSEHTILCKARNATKM